METRDRLIIAETKTDQEIREDLHRLRCAEKDLEDFMSEHEHEIGDLKKYGNMNSSIVMDFNFLCEQKERAQRQALLSMAKGFAEIAEAL